MCIFTVIYTRFIVDLQMMQVFYLGIYLLKQVKTRGGIIDFALARKSPPVLYSLKTRLFVNSGRCYIAVNNMPTLIH